MMDSLNRHYLNCYQDSWVETPNIDRLAKKSSVFENHYAGSLPCMPARRDILTGRINFLETPWSPLQPYDECYPRELRKQTNTYSHMITDHYHYFELHGMGYHTDFDTWEFRRGQEGDHWHAQVKDPHIPEYRGKNRRQDWINRTRMNSENEEEYSTPQCFMKAIEFLEGNHEEDNWHLHLEVFDPHEPFLCPQKFLDMYDDTWDGRYLFDWPSYKPVDEDKDAIQHIRKRYAATLTMADKWLGKLLDKMDELHAWEDTTIILTTDHGYLAGEHGYWAKNYMFDYKELVHIPLLVYSPKALTNGKRVKALTTTIDIMPTLLELHGAEPSKHVQGKSILHLLEKDEDHHDAVLYGYFGKDVNMTDGMYTYCRQPQDSSIVYHHTAMPVGAVNNPSSYANAEMGTFLKHEMPVYRVPVKSSRHHNAPSYHLLYNIEEDPFQQKPIRDSELEEKYVEKLKDLLHRYDAPNCQFTRLGLDD